MNKEEVLKLATLARIEISNTEAESLSHEFEAILKYVSEIKKVSDLTPNPSPSSRRGVDSRAASGGEVRNVFRADENPHESGKFTEAILKEAPSKQGEFIKVKKII